MWWGGRWGGQTWDGMGWDRLGWGGVRCVMSETRAATARGGGLAQAVKIDVSCDVMYTLLILYHITGLLWTYGVLTGVAYITIAGCFASW